MTINELSFPSEQFEGNFGIFRFDGKSFGRFTRRNQFAFPEDTTFIKAMDAAAMNLFEEMSGAHAAFIVSDEISLVLRASENGEFAYGGRTNKIASIGASICGTTLSMIFQSPAYFDGRGVGVETEEDVEAYFYERHRSGRKNAISMAAETKFSHKQLMGVPTNERLAMLEEAGVIFDEEYSPGFCNGRVIRRMPTQVEVPAAHAKYPGEFVIRNKPTLMAYSPK